MVRVDVDRNDEVAIRSADTLVPGFLQRLRKGRQRATPDRWEFECGKLGLYLLRDVVEQPVEERQGGAQFLFGFTVETGREQNWIEHCGDFGLGRPAKPSLIRVGPCAPFLFGDEAGLEAWMADRLSAPAFVRLELKLHDEARAGIELKRQYVIPLDDGPVLLEIGSTLSDCAGSQQLEGAGLLSVGLGAKAPRGDQRRLLRPCALLPVGGMEDHSGPAPPKLGQSFLAMMAEVRMDHGPI